MRSSFFGFSVAQRALANSQKALDIVGQNMSNMFTTGYTRQRLDTVSIGSVSYSNKYNSLNSTGIGQGAKIQSITQVRDSYLDSRFRKEASKVGELDAELSVLQDLEKIFDETTMDGLQSSISDLITQMQTLASNAGNSEFDGIVKSSAEILMQMFNQSAKELDGVREEQEYNLSEVNITRVNDILASISDLNSSIRKSEIYGNTALELQDQRNVLIDELSTYMKLDIKTTLVEISPGIAVNELTISLPSNGTTPGAVLVDKNGTATLSTEKDANGKMTIKYDYTDADGVTTTADVTDNFTTGTIKGMLDMLNESGEFDNPASSTRGIGYYENMLDTMVSEFATQLNHLNSIESDPPTDPPTYDEWLPLFESSDGEPINASNIQISSAWKNNEYGITTTKIDLAGDNSGGNENVMKMIALFSEKLDFENPTTGGTLFNGTFQEFLSNVSNILALDAKSTETLLDNNLTVLTNLEDMRDSVSGVNLDEETINLTKYQQAYNAASRFMSTLDEALDTLINKTGVVGR